LSARKRTEPAPFAWQPTCKGGSGLMRGLLYQQTAWPVCAGVCWCRSLSQRGACYGGLLALVGWCSCCCQLLPC
jgi:hypothetical protein